MVFSQTGYGCDSVGDSSNSESLLRDIEAISKALYLDKPPSRVLARPPDVPPDSSGQSHLLQGAKPSSKPRVLAEETLCKDKKSSIWNWKPLKALTHIRNRRFNCCFFLHVHSIEGLSSRFSNVNVCVHWIRKEELQTCSYRVSEGVAEFEETLMHRCSVYGSRNGPRQTAKYEAKHFLLYASVVEAPDLDIGKHWIDLTKLLPLTFEELEEDKSLGKWSTSFKLSGVARGASLNVSFGFLVMGDNLVHLTRNLNVPELLNLSQSSLGSATRIGRLSLDDSSIMLKQAGSVPSSPKHQSYISSHSVDFRNHLNFMPNQGLGLSQSITFLYEKLDESRVKMAELGVSFEDEECLKQKHQQLAEHQVEFVANDCEDLEFMIIEKGIEPSTKEQLKLEKGAAQVPNNITGVCYADDSNKFDKICLDDEIKFNSRDVIYENLTDDLEVDEWEYREAGEHVNDLATRKPNSTFLNLSVLASAGLDGLPAVSDLLGQEDTAKIRSDYEASSLDDIVESVANDFLNMLEMENIEPDSPRGCLLLEFEKEFSAFGNCILDVDASEEQSELGSAASTGSERENFLEEFDFLPKISASESEPKRVHQFLKNKRKTIVLEDLQTRSLMQHWGLNQEAFKSSACYSSGGFGSPIYLAESLESPQLGEGLGPIIQLKDGGFLRSMCPSLFRNAENGASLIIQASCPVVLPAEMGFDMSEILQHLALIGVGKFSLQMNDLMPLEDITGKNLQQVSWKAAPSGELSERVAKLLVKSEIGKNLFGERRNSHWFSYAQDYYSLHLSSVDVDMGLNYVSLLDLVPLAMDTIEFLSMEGLKVQSDYSTADTHSCIEVHSICPNSDSESFAFDDIGNAFHSLNPHGDAKLQPLDAKDCSTYAHLLLGLSLKLQDWIRLDLGIPGNEEPDNEGTLKILTAHHVKDTSLINERLTGDGEWGRACGEKFGVLGDKLMVAFRLQLRDPSQNYEPIGVPMFAIIQAERVLVPLKQHTSKLCNDAPKKGNWEKDDQSESIELEREDDRKPNHDNAIGFSEFNFKLAEVHLAGLNTVHCEKQLWCPANQQQAGPRWLLASGMMGKNTKQCRTVQPQDKFWSISSRLHGTRVDWNRWSEVNSHIRNPDVFLSDGTIGLGHV